MRHHTHTLFPYTTLFRSEKFAETKDGLPMEFATFEDETALYDATIFPEVYRRCCHLLSPDRPYVLRGIVEASFGIVTDRKSTRLNSSHEWISYAVICLKK